jgi:hypothetical protein
MTVDLTTTNVLLGVLATVSVLQVLAVIGLFVAGFMMFRRLTHLIERIQERQVAPAAARVNEILSDVRAMTDVAKRAAERIDRWTGLWRRP